MPMRRPAPNRPDKTPRATPKALLAGRVRLIWAQPVAGVPPHARYVRARHLRDPQGDEIQANLADTLGVEMPP